jgi:hypothetical protein
MYGRYDKLEGKVDERERKEKGRARRGRPPRRKALNKQLNLLSVRLLSSTVRRWVYVHVSTYGVLVEAASGAQRGTERGHDRIMTRRPRQSPCQCHNAIHRWL